MRARVKGGKHLRTRVSHINIKILLLLYFIQQFNGITYHHTCTANTQCAFVGRFFSACSVCCLFPSFVINEHYHTNIRLLESFLLWIMHMKWKLCPYEMDGVYDMNGVYEMDVMLVNMKWIFAHMKWMFATLMGHRTFFVSLTNQTREGGAH